LTPSHLEKRQKIKIGLVTSQCPKILNEEKYDFFVIFKLGKMEIINNNVALTTFY
jgi:hypothetical protein